MTVIDFQWGKASHTKRRRPQDFEEIEFKKMNLTSAQWAACGPPAEKEAIHLLLDTWLFPEQYSTRHHHALCGFPLLKGYLSYGYKVNANVFQLLMQN